MHTDSFCLLAQPSRIETDYHRYIFPRLTSALHGVCGDVLPFSAVRKHHLLRESLAVYHCAVLIIHSVKAVLYCPETYTKRTGIIERKQVVECADSLNGSLTIKAVFPRIPLLADSLDA